MKKILFLALATLMAGVCHSQKKSTASAALENYGKTHYEEKIVLDINSNFFLTGESLLFKAYCVNAESNSSSSLSKVAYVELVGPGSIPALQSKIELRGGMGLGDFFLPSSLTSGNYTLIAYTNWMKNYSLTSFFQTQVTIINPFKRPSATDAAKNQKTTVRFFPEGGVMVAGVKNIVGFRGTRGDNAFKFSGKVLDDAGKTIAEFHSNQDGIGKFEVTPAIGQEYKTVIMDSLQNITFSTFPKTSATGIAMEMNETNAGYTFQLSHKALGKETMRLLIHQRSKPFYESEVQFNNGTAEVSIPANSIPTGISQATLLNSTNGVECRRLIWKTPNNKSLLDLNVEKRNYRLREKVDVRLKMNDTTVLSNISINVRKLEPELAKAPKVVRGLFGQSEVAHSNDELISVDESSFFDPGTKDSDTNTLFLPEVRGNLVKGSVLDALGKAKPEQQVYLSIPSRNYQFYASKTDSTGRFFFNTERIPTGSNLVFTINAKTCPDCKITVDHANLDYSSFSPLPLQIDSTFRKVIERRSVLSQIENAYYLQKQDSIKVGSQERFYGKPDKTYLLDDYVRFPTMEDIFIEYVTEIIDRKSGDKHEIKAMNFVTRQAFTEDPLILLDGVPLFDVEQIMNYNPLALQKIEVVGRRYFYGPLDVQGIISLSTYNGDVANISLADKVPFIGTQPRKKYYSPDYGTNALDKIPDYRVQLYWNPEITVVFQGTNVSFFTSDIEGDYEIVAQGIQSDGSPVYRREVIHVEK